MLCLNLEINEDGRMIQHQLLVMGLKIKGKDVGRIFMVLDFGSTKL